MRGCRHVIDVGPVFYVLSRTESRPSNAALCKALSAFSSSSTSQRCGVHELLQNARYVVILSLALMSDVFCSSAFAKESRPQPVVLRSCVQSMMLGSFPSSTMRAESWCQILLCARILVILVHGINVVPYQLQYLLRPRAAEACKASGKHVFADFAAILGQNRLEPKFSQVVFACFTSMRRAN